MSKVDVPSAPADRIHANHSCPTAFPFTTIASWFVKIKHCGGWASLVKTAVVLAFQHDPTHASSSIKISNLKIIGYEHIIITDLQIGRPIILNHRPPNQCAMAVRFSFLWPGDYSCCRSCFFFLAPFSRTLSGCSCFTGQLLNMCHLYTARCAGK